ncbi:hypothetical protein K503DRAFT_806641 [Rhizopogon vinicolor AM-OR11-026]|uniref:Uncharacterized protein n=1 Tax=Rhizopogon vinicolor AM-OR11-026 TaxID=1314800 RepID=A0A1B7ME34_9AGAM|nr:hypothetical protein K503DRAFT_806641 [Rhizopogon vinicolor AM-OR11-026]
MVEPTSSLSTISSLDADSKPLDPVEKFIPAPPTLSPPPLIIPAPACKVKETLPTILAKSKTPPPIRQRNRQTKKKQEVLASFGLPLTQNSRITSATTSSAKNADDLVIVTSTAPTTSAATVGSTPPGTSLAIAPLFMEREFSGYAPLMRISTPS